MKKLLSLLILIAVITVFCTPASAQILWRGAKTMKKGSIIAMGEWYNFDLSQKYSFANEKWDDNDDTNVKRGIETMFGYGINDRWEAMVHVPFRFHSFETDTSDDSNSGIGDIVFKTRYGLIPWSKEKGGLAVTASLRMGTGENDHEYSFCNCGDGTTDYGFGGIYSSGWYKKFRGHLKVNYWVNGSNDDDFKIGNEMKFIAKLDRSFSKKFFAFMTFIYFNQDPKLDKLGQIVQDPAKVYQKTRNNFVLGGVYKPRPGLFIRPKLVFFIDGQGGKMYSWAPKIDVWYIFSL